MTRNIIIAAIFIITILILTYYFKSSSLTLSDKGVKLQIKQKSVLLESSIVNTTPISHANVNIMQTKLSDGSYFEVAEVETLYEFNQNIKNVIKLIFQADKVNEIFSIRGVTAMQVTLKNAQVINLFLEDTDTKALKLHYGIAYDVYLPIIKEIMGNDYEAFPVGGLLELPTPMTNWDVVMGDINAEVLTSIDH